LIPQPQPSRGQIWLVDLDPTRSREQRGGHPALVVSTDAFNHGPAELVIVCPITKVAKSIPSHVAIARAHTGLQHDSYVICEQVRCISRDRLDRPIGTAPAPALERVAFILRALLDL
jgi:mRNA interferase MazF